MTWSRNRNEILRHSSTGIGSFSLQLSAFSFQPSLRPPFSQLQNFKEQGTFLALLPLSAFRLLPVSALSLQCLLDTLSWFDFNASIKIQIFFAPTPFFPQTMEPRISRMARMENDFFLIRAIREIRGSIIPAGAREFSTQRRQDAKTQRGHPQPNMRSGQERLANRKEKGKKMGARI
jgi:hypothetical protein